MDTFLIWLGENALKGTLVTAIVFFVLLFFSHKIPAAYKYKLWYLSAVRFIMVPVFFLSFSFYALLPSFAPEEQALIQAPQVEQPTNTLMDSSALENVEQNISPLSSETASKSWIATTTTVIEENISLILFGLWAIGALGIIMLFVIRNIWAHSLMKRLTPLNNEKINAYIGDSCKLAGINRKFTLYETELTGSPVLLGFFKPKLLIPKNLLNKLKSQEFRYILLHEFMHMKKHDILINWLFGIVCALQWFNPFAWYAFTRMKSDREEARDANVLSLLDKKELKEYGSLILKLSNLCGSGANFAESVGIMEKNKKIKRRITMIKKFKTMPFRSTLLAVAIIGAVGVSCLSEKKSNNASNPKNEKDVHAEAIADQAKENQKTVLKPEDILAKMAKAYATCKSYQDTGTVKTVFIQTTGERIIEKPFTTAFVRPDQFRFEYKKKVDSYLKEKPCYIVWRKGSEVLTWFNARSDVIEKAKSLSMAISGATGVSGSSAHTIPALLLPEIGGSKLSVIKEAKMLKDGIFDNVKCFRIQGKFTISHDNGKVVRKPTTIWIDKHTFLVRRIDKETVFTKANFRTKKTTIYYPSLNGSIPNKMLELDPPGGSKMLKRMRLAKKAPSLSPNSPMGNSLSDKKEARRILMIGYGLSAKQAAEQEQKLLKNPDDLNTITMLLAYYRRDNTAGQKRAKYLLWMIEHHPDAVIFDSYVGRLDAKFKATANTARKLWIEQIKKNPNNLQALWNAASSVSSIDKKLAEKFYIKGQSLDAENPKWAERLGYYYFWSKQPEKALNEFRKAYSKNKDNFYIISRMARSAFDCGKIQEAGKYALEMQRLAATYGDRNENYAKLLFNANLILGRIALKQGRTGEAGKYLLKAGKTPASLKGMPDFTLAKGLLVAGEKTIVLQFLQSCSRFWDKALCKKWIKQINEGKVPDFKYNPYAYKTKNEKVVKLIKQLKDKDPKVPEVNHKAAYITASSVGKSAVLAANSWLSLIDNGQYGGSWDNAAEHFKAAISKKQWERAIQTVRKPLGKNLSRKLISKKYYTSLPGAPDGKYTVIQFKSSFENKKSAIETITPMMGKDGKWRVSGYYIK